MDLCVLTGLMSRDLKLFVVGGLPKICGAQSTSMVSYFYRTHQTQVCSKCSFKSTDETLSLIVSNTHYITRYLSSID